MIIPDKKKTVSIILSKMKPGGIEKSASVANEQPIGQSHALQAIAEDMMTAFKSGSVMDLVDALQSLKDEIQSEDEVQDEQEPQEMGQE